MVAYASLLKHHLSKKDDELQSSTWPKTMGRNILS
jgi:hypothetical protein